ncbi:MAG: hypothetical protein IKK75_11560 [Clostridia bacterium]|nr:hypothetical protein [Clostridia bacterium]
MPWKQSLLRQIDELTYDLPHSPVFIPLHHKVKKSSAPLLFIGLGGTGLRIGKRVRKKMIECFEPAAHPIPGMEDLPPYTRFLGIDCDRITLEHMGYVGDECCDICDYHAGAKLAAKGRENLPGYITSWLNPDVSSFDGVDHGTAGERQIGRFCLFSNIEKVVAMMHHALSQIRGGTGMIQIFIASSTTGGTGSAILLDMAYLLRHVARELDLDRRLRITALLTTPDVHDHVAYGPIVGLMRARGYASLKELDYWMNAPERNEVFEQRYSPMLNVRWDGKPFDDCILLSCPMYPQDPAAFLRDTLPGNVADYIASLYAEHDLHQAPGAISHSFPYHSYRANIDAMIAAAPKAYDTCRRYTALGVCKKSIPWRTLLMNEGILLFDAVSQCADRAHTPNLFSKEMFVDFVNGIVGKRAAGLLMNVQLPHHPGLTIHTLLQDPSIVPHNPAIDHRVSAYFDLLENRTNGSEAAGVIRSVVSEVEQELVVMFMDPERGPWYTSRFIDAASGQSENDVPQQHSLLQVLNILRSNVMNKRAQAHNEFQHVSRQAEADYQTIRTSATFLAFLHGNNYRKYMGSCEMVYRCKREFWHQDLLLRLFDALIQRVEELNMQVIKPLCGTLSGLIEAFREIDPSLEADPRDLVSSQLLVSVLREQYMSPDKANEMAAFLFRDMIRPCLFDAAKGDYESVPVGERWLAVDPHTNTTVGVNLLDNLRRVLSDCFRPFNSTSPVDFLKQQYPAAIQLNGMLNLSAFVPDMVQQMRYYAAPMLKEHPVHPISIPHSGLLDTSFITAPLAVPGLTDALPPVVQGSLLDDRIVWVRHIDGVSLYHYGDLERCEQLYLELVRKGSCKGIHLYEGEHINWRNLPSPRPDLSANP